LYGEAEEELKTLKKIAGVPAKVPTRPLRNTSLKLVHLLTDDFVFTDSKVYCVCKIQTHRWKLLGKNKINLGICNDIVHNFLDTHTHIHEKVLLYH
jgi:hypothetical protein